MTFKPIKYRQHNGYDTEAASDEATLPKDQIGESLTVQSMAEDADINVIVKRFGLTGKLPENPRPPTYGDYLDVTDFRSALEAVQAAEIAFMEYPADVRAKFRNDPQEFLDFCSKVENREAMRALGMLKEPPAPPTPPPAPPGPPPA